jgi:transposase-like protein
VAKKKVRVFDREMKIDTVKRMLRGENISALMRELGIARAVLYRWKNQYREDGSQAFRRRRGRPPNSAPAKVQAKTAGELAAAKQRLVEMERKIGQQQLELDFFRQALRQVAADRAAMNGRGAKASMRSSKR